MTKYRPLWTYIAKSNQPTLQISFDKIEQILGFPIDHSFLNAKKELLAYGYQVKKISLKEKTITFQNPI